MDPTEFSLLWCCVNISVLIVAALWYETTSIGRLNYCALTCLGVLQVNGYLLGKTGFTISLAALALAYVVARRIVSTRAVPEDSAE